MPTWVTDGALDSAFGAYLMEMLPRCLEEYGYEPPVMVMRMLRGKHHCGKAVRRGANDRQV